MDCMSIPSLVLIAQVVFLLERGRKCTQSRMPPITLRTSLLARVWVKRNTINIVVNDQAIPLTVSDRPVSVFVSCDQVN